MVSAIGPDSMDILASFIGEHVEILRRISKFVRPVVRVNLVVASVSNPDIRFVSPDALEIGVVRINQGVDVVGRLPAFISR